MLLRQMRYFISVVENNSFTEAAEQEFVSQSAISQQIQSLENELGTELLKRQHRKFRLTAAGEYFYRESRQLLSQIDRMMAETRRIGNDDEAHLEIGYLQVYGGQVLHQVIAQFSEIYPEVTIDLINGTHEELYQELLQKSVNLVLSDQRRAFSPDYVNFELIQPTTSVEISSRNPLSKKTILDVNDLIDTPCILITSKDQRQHEVAFYKDTLGFSNNFIYAENLDEARLMVAGNRGFLPIENVGILADPIATTKRIPVQKEGTPITRKYCAFWKKTETNYYIEEFAELLKKIIWDQTEKNLS